MKKNKDVEFMKLEDFTEKIKSKLGSGEWITVYSHKSSNRETDGTFSAFIPIKRKKDILSRSDWEVHYGDGHPGHIFTFKDGKQRSRFYRFGNDDGIEPMIICRNFHGIKGESFDVNQEFVHYFNLYHDFPTGNYIFVDEDGDEEVVIKTESDNIKVKTYLITEFLAVKEMLLAIYFDISRFSAKSIEDLGLGELVDDIYEENVRYVIGIRNFSYGINGDEIKSQSWIMGKKLIEGDKKYKPTIYSKKEKYEKFIIKIDNDGNSVENTCDPEKLANFYGKNKGEPYFVTPVFFQRGVLTEYYSNPEKYSVEDGYLRCKGLWGMRIDNNHPEYVVAFLGDLGQCLSHKNQLYWKRFNVAHQGGLSRTAWKRGFEVKFTDPDQSDLFFKQKYTDFNAKWKNKYDWALFLPLHAKDEMYFKILRVPLNNNQHEFEQLVLALSKLIVDSVNVTKLKAFLPKEFKDRTNKVNILQEYCKISDFIFDPGMYEFLKDIYGIRTYVSHRKGKKEYQKISTKYKFGSVSYVKIFEEFLINAIKMFNSLESTFLD